MTNSKVIELVRKVRVDRVLPETLHTQLSRGIETLVARGKLKPGDRLPNVADLSLLCKVSKGTAMRAVDELGRRHVVTVKRRAGIHVAKATPRAVEVLFFAMDSRDGARLSDFLEQVIDGLRAGYAEPARQFMATLVNGHAISGRGLLTAADARGVDGMVFYRPTPDVIPAIAEAARGLPCVSLLRPIPGGAAACVAFAVEKPLTRVLSNLIEAGATRFAYVGQTTFLKDQRDGPYAPYRRIYETALDILADAALEMRLCLTPGVGLSRPVEQVEDRLLRQAASLPDNTVVLAQTGTLAERLSALDKQFNIITYTEYRRTLERCRGKATVLYGGLDLLGRAASQILKERIAGSKTAPMETVLIEPDVVAAPTE